MTTFAETRERRRRPPIRILHLATSESNYEVAYCGKRRGEEPLKPGATGETCVVCQDLSHRRKPG